MRPEQDDNRSFRELCWKLFESLDKLNVKSVAVFDGKRSKITRSKGAKRDADQKAAEEAVNRAQDENNGGDAGREDFISNEKKAIKLP